MALEENKQEIQVVEQPESKEEEAQSHASEASRGLSETFPDKRKKKRDSSYRMPIWVLAGALIISLFGGFGGAFLYQTLFPQSKKTIMYQTTGTNNTVTNTSVQGMTDVIEAIKPSVVEITTETVSTNSFYGEYVNAGAGSGVILTQDGYIVTNHHVIEKTSKIKVKLADGTAYDAELIGSDAQTDLALLKIDANQLSPVILGDSDQLKVGEWTFAIGNPLGSLGGSVSEGIISALGRQISIDGQKMTLLQTTAAVNPGNSGGGLFNMKGELIGIVNAKSSGYDIEGIGFAIPVNVVKPVIEELMSNGYVSGRSQLGVTVVSISDRQTAFQYGVNEYGLYIYSVMEQSAADKAGLKAGDRILKVEDIDVDADTDLQSVIQSYKVGQTITIEIDRNGEKMDVRVTLEEAKTS